MLSKWMSDFAQFLCNVVILQKFLSWVKEKPNALIHAGLEKSWNHTYPQINLCMTRLQVMTLLWLNYLF